MWVREEPSDIGQESGQLYRGPETPQTQPCLKFWGKVTESPYPLSKVWVVCCSEKLTHFPHAEFQFLLSDLSHCRGGDQEGLLASKPGGDYGA